MAKIFGLFGSMNGKLADVVMVNRNGVQIVRKYQPNVANPNTEGQVTARAKLKLMSQLAAVMGNIIAIPREGISTSRNQFVKLNYKKVTFANNAANINLLGVQITKSVIGLPALTATREGNVINVELSANVATDAASRVVYAAFIQNEDGSLRYLYSTVVSDPGADQHWSTAFNANTNAPVYVYAYAIKDMNEKASVTFGDLTVLTADRIAEVLTSRTLTAADVQVTETRAVYSAANRDIDPEREAKKAK